ncbi:MAG TPA: hypothetical protein VKY92_21130, partial [Verrucomicrobiae bacterium]|nr:hypothetical protein [Verrucomicrobiae bacterium]
MAAAYILGRLSNRELTEAPRGEFVYTALLQRSGLDRKYRVEALDGLAKIRGTNRIQELLRAINELDQKGDDAREPIRELASFLLQSGQDELATHADSFEAFSLKGRLAITRQTGWAASVTATKTTEPWWNKAKDNPALLTDLVYAVEWIPDVNLRSTCYEKLKALATGHEPAELQRAAISALSAVPGHDAETFDILAGLVRGATNVRESIESLQRVQAGAWPQDLLQSTVEAIVGYLQQVPASQRTDP